MEDCCACDKGMTFYYVVTPGVVWWTTSQEWVFVLCLFY